MCVRASVVAAVAALTLIVPATAQASDHKRFPLGTLTLVPADPGPPVEVIEEYLPFQVECPAISGAARGILGVTRAAPAEERGLVMFFQGGLGTGYIGTESPAALPFFAALRDAGLTLVWVRWVDPWLSAPLGESVGAARLGCRPATVIKWVHDELYRRGSRKAARRSLCGFCITGNSGGASQVSYPLSHYGLDRILDGVFPTGGPVHSGLYETCQRFPGTASYENWYNVMQVLILDSAYGFPVMPPPGVPPNSNPITAPPFGEGPCANNDSSFIPRWLADSIDTGGSDYFYPRTVLHFLFGELDNGNAGLPGPAAAPWIATARYFEARAQRCGSPFVSEEVVPGVEHGIYSFPAGLDALREALLAPTPRRGSDGAPKTKGSRRDC